MRRGDCATVRTVMRGGIYGGAVRQGACVIGLSPLQGAWVMKISDTEDQKIFSVGMCRARPL